MEKITKTEKPFSDVSECMTNLGANQSKHTSELSKNSKAEDRSLIVSDLSNLKKEIILGILKDPSIQKVPTELVLERAEKLLDWITKC